MKTKRLPDITERKQAGEQLREREAQYRSVFEATTDGLLIRDWEGVIVEANPAACRMFGYTREEFLGLPPTATVHPDYHVLLAEDIRTVTAGSQFQARSLDLRKDGTSFPVEVHGTPFTYKGKPHILNVLRDITEQVRAEERLRERETQYRSIFEATTDALIIRNLDGFVVEINPAACHMFGYTREEFLGLHATTLIRPDYHYLAAELIRTVTAGGQLQARAVDVRKDGSQFPVEIHGTMFTFKGEPHTLTVVRDITEQVQAYQLLEQRVEERTRELSTLLEVTHDVASTLELKPLLHLILDQLKGVAEYNGAAVFTVAEEDLVLIATRELGPEEHLVHHRIPLKQAGIIWEVIGHHEPVIIGDVREDTPLARAYREMVGDLLGTSLVSLRAALAVPLMLKERAMGLLLLTSGEPNSFTSRHATLALAFAHQAAMALENARLYEQAQEWAAHEERQRLARELHDSVSQALYGISLGVHTARTLLDRDPRQVSEPLDYVLSLAEAALAEMRALIFELRPESLETEGLCSALTKQGAALQARHGLSVSTALCDEPALPLKVKQELYRIAQEALQNTVKHAQARTVDLRLDRTAEAIILEVRDDGRGFGPAGAFPGHLGLHSMREPVTRVGGTFQAESASGQGTRICARIPDLAQM